MKYFCAMLLTLMVALNFTACTSEESNNELNGTVWVGMDIDGTYTLSFTSNTAFTFTVSGETITGTYTYSGSALTLTANGEKMTGTVTALSIILDGQEGYFLVLTKKK